MNAIGKTFCELVSIIKILIPWRGEPENMSRDDDLVADQISKQCGFSMNRSNDEDEYNVHQSGSETRHQVNSYYAQVDSDGITETDDSDKVLHPGREENAKVSPKKHGFDTHSLKGNQTIGKNEDEPDICDENEVAPSVYVDFENNGLLWLPPEPEDEEDERETILFDDDGDYGNVTEEYHYRDRLGKDHNKFMKDAFNGHFRALITQHLEVENLLVKDNDKNSWLEIITALSWEVATLLKPDMSRGGGMDPASYVKIKCIACGSRIESTVVKGVVCTKNVAHRQMTSRMDKPRLLIIAGALEYQHGTNVISSVDTLLQQEMDHMKMVVGKIAAYNPDVLLVEKRVSRYVHMYLLEKGISMALNVKRHLLERIARCTGTQIVPSIDHLSSRKLGYCEKFHVEKFVENLSSGDGLSKKTTAKTLMFFEGCPRPMGFTILLRGADEDELKKVKRVVQYGVFAAYNLALETSFLADERASPLPEFLCTSEETREDPKQLLVPNISVVENTVNQYQPENPEIVNEEKNPTKEEFPLSPFDQQSILVSLASWCAWKGTVCERSHLFRIKYYGNFDIPLGRFLRDNLFDEANRCYSCEMPSESHVHCYTHLHGTLTISVKKLPEMILPGERDGNIWIWHRCLRCPRTNGIPPATRRIVMSDAAWGLSFGKFLELSFSNHAATSRVASCGHSLHRDCLRFYGFGKMVACFRYASINVHSVYLPSYKLEFEYGNQNWIQKELDEVVNKAKLLFSEVLNALGQIEEKKSSAVPVSSALKTPELRSQVAELEGMLQKEKVEFEETLQKILNQEKSKGQHWIDILEVNQLMRHLVSQSYIWDHHLTHVASGARLQHSLFWKSSKYIMPIGVNDTVIPVYDDEPSSIIAYSLLSPQYSAQLTDQKERPKHEVVIDSQRNFGSVEDLMSDNHNSSILDPMLYTKAMHAIVSFEEDSPHGKVKYSVTCYYAKQFEALRRICCSSELDYIRSLSRCEKLEPKGGKNNVFFSRTLDDRFIIKQITKTEVESFIKFGPDYFKYLTESIVSRSPTCMAKILGIYQTKHIKGGKESKMDVLIMENVLFKRTVTRIYDLKGYSRSRYNQDSSGSNKVLLDQNLIEAMPTSPIYVGNKAKRLLERAIWNDTAFLASIDVMDYSLLVGVDEEKHELVIGIIDFMRKYTWVTHLETWTSGIIGWSKNVSPTVMSPMQYKKRFRKAISTYFLMLPDQWSPSLIPSDSQSDLCGEDNNA